MKGVNPAGLARFARQAQKLAEFSGEVNILVSGNRRLQELNRKFRHKNRPTDVLSFLSDGVGDIAISAEMARRNAGRYRHSLADELKILVLHGILHLAGHDHEVDNGGMAELENRLRARLKLPRSLIARASADHKKSGTRRRTR